MTTAQCKGLIVSRGDLRRVKEHIVRRGVVTCSQVPSADNDLNPGRIWNRISIWARFAAPARLPRVLPIASGRWGVDRSTGRSIASLPSSVTTGITRGTDYRGFSRIYIRRHDKMADELWEKCWEVDGGEGSGSRGTRGTPLWWNLLLGRARLITGLLHLLSPKLRHSISAPIAVVNAKRKHLSRPRRGDFQREANRANLWTGVGANYGSLEIRGAFIRLRASIRTCLLRV